jgi:hypothetical protein
MSSGSDHRNETTTEAPIPPLPGQQDPVDLLQTAHECDEEYRELLQTEQLFLEAFAKLQSHQVSLEQAIAECSEEQPSHKAAATSSKKHAENEAILRLQEALMMDDSSSSTDDDNNQQNKQADDADSFTIL